MPTLIDKTTGKTIGTITQAQLQALVDHLEEESDTDQDYWVNAGTIDWLEDNGADASLVSMLRLALGEREDMDIEWKT
jgi:hypothetical protein